MICGNIVKLVGTFICLRSVTHCPVLLETNVYLAPLGVLYHLSRIQALCPPRQLQQQCQNLQMRPPNRQPIAGDVSDPEHGICLTVDTGTIPTGTIKTCSCFTQVAGFNRDLYTCDSIAYDFDITVNDLLAWNTWIGPNCDTGVYANLSDVDTRTLCVQAASTTTTLQPGTTTSSIGPTPSGTAPDCTKYYTAVSGDSYYTIAQRFAITLEQFYAWNPTGKLPDQSSAGCLN
ncbi:hypothetical protein BDV06DRAFT_218700 [Aspergillus oleicola]